MDSAFVSPKSALALVPTLVHPESSSHVSLAVDASESHVGAVFQQLVQGSWAPLAFCSKKISSAESCFSLLYCELLAAYSALKHFHFLLEGRRFILFTVPCDETVFSAAKAMYGSPLCLPREFLYSVDLPPGEFLDRNVSALRGLTLSPPLQLWPQLSLCFFMKTPLSSHSLSCIEVPKELSVARINFSPWNTVSIDRLKPVLGLVLSP